MSDISDFLDMPEPEDETEEHPYRHRFVLDGAKAGSCELYGELYPVSDHAGFAGYAAQAHIDVDGEGFTRLLSVLGPETRRSALKALSDYARRHGGTGDLIELDGEGMELRIWHSQER